MKCIVSCKTENYGWMYIETPMLMFSTDRQYTPYKDSAYKFESMKQVLKIMEQYFPDVLEYEMEGVL